MKLFKATTSPFLKNSLTVISGTVAAQAIVLCMQPYLRRIYPAEVFGQFSVFLSITGIPVIISTLRYELAVVLPEKESEAQNLLAASVIINFLFSFILAVFVWIFRSQLLHLLNVSDDFEFALLAAPLAIFLYGNYQLLNYWFIRRKTFMSTNYIKIGRRSSEAVSQSLLRSPLGSSGLIWGEIVGRFFLSLLSFWFLFKSGFSLKNIRLSEIKQVLKRYVDFPKHSAFPSLLNSAGLLFPAIVININYGEHVTGLYDACAQVLAVPVVFISVSVSNVLTQKLSESYKNGQSVSKYIWDITKIMLLFSAVGVVLLFLFAPYLFGKFFGEEYVQAGVFASILGIAFAARFTVSTLALPIKV